MYIKVTHKVACLGSQSCFAKILYINNIMWCMVEEYLFRVFILHKLIYKIVAIFYTCINNNEIPGDLSCKDMMFICENNTLSSHVKDHHCYGYKINRAFHNKKLLKWNGLVFRCAHSWNIFQHSKRNFVFPRGNVLSSMSIYFFLILILFCH